jgi:hypothetical protein
MKITLTTKNFGMVTAEGTHEELLPFLLQKENLVAHAKLGRPLGSKTKGGDVRDCPVCRVSFRGKSVTCLKRICIVKQLSNKMIAHWKKLTPEQKTAIGKKIIISRRDKAASKATTKYIPVHYFNEMKDVVRA